MNENFMSQMPLPTNNEKHGKSGPAIAIVVIIVLLAFGAYYFWNQAQNINTDDNSQTINPELQSDTNTGINAELKADLDTLGNDDLGESDLESIDAEFNQ